MEQQNRQPNQEKTESKPPIKTKWKLLVIIVVISVLALIVGIWSFTKPLLFVGFIFLSVFIIIFFALRTFLKLTTTRSIIVGVVLFILLFFFTLRILYFIKEKFFPPFADDMPRFTQQQYKMNQSVDQENKTVDWQTYRNEELGFEVKYPEELILVDVPGFEKSSSRRLIFFCFDYELNSEECGHVIGEFTVYPFSEPVSAEIWVANRVEQDSYSLETIKQDGSSKKILRLRPDSGSKITLLLPGQSGTSSLVTLDEGSRRKESYFIQTDKKTILNFNYTERLETSITQPVIINKELIEAIFSTFRFVE